MTEASMTEPAVGASTCASGSHVCSGNKGTLMANAMKKARKSSISCPEVKEILLPASIFRIAG
jgi:hypothetical protein